MTTRSTPEPAHGTPIDTFGSVVRAGVPPHSRRDMLRAMAILGGGTAVGAASSTFRDLQAGRAALAQATNQDGDVETDVELRLPLNPFGQPVTIDPHRTVNWGPFWVVLPHVWAGPLRFDANGAVEPDLADRIEPVDDASLWRITLKADLRFASGRAIGSEDCIASWKRALDPQSVSPMATFMSNVNGFDAFIAGESTDIGFAAIDDRTIAIQLVEADSSFPSSLATFVWAVLDLDLLANSDADDPLLAGAGAGAWQFTELIDGDRLVMEPNPEHWGEPSPSVTRVIWQILDGVDADSRAIDQFRADELAVADVPLSMLATVRDDEVLSANLITIDSQASTIAIGLDFNQEPFSDVRVRRAVAAAVDRQGWASEIWQEGFVPASGFVPPSVSLTSGYAPATADFGDSGTAAQLFEQAGFDPAADAPEIVYFQPATDSADDIERHAALLRMIEDNCGLVIRHDTSLTSDQIAARQRDNDGRQFDIVWWWTVSDTAAILNTAANPDSTAMRGWFNWSAELPAVDDSDPGAAALTFQAHISEANASLDPETRNRAFQDAEQIVLDSAVYIPLGHWVQRFLQQPWLQGTRQGPWSGSLPARIDADVVVRGRNR